MKFLSAYILRSSSVIVTTLISYSICAQWQTVGPYGGAMHALELNNNKLFIGTNNGAFSLNSGDSIWNSANNGIEKKPVNMFTVRNNVLLAGLSGHGVYSTTNNGLTWNLASAGLTSYSLMTLFNATSGLFVGTADGVFYSTNSGTQWTLRNNGIPANYYIYCMEQMGDTIFGGSYGLGLYFTNDNGLNWNIVSGGFPPNTFVYDLYKDGNNLFAGTSAGVYKSIDRGLNWNLSNSGFPAGMWAKCFAGLQGYIFAGTYSEGILVSTDGGVTWNFSNNGIPDLPIQSGLPHNFPSVEDLKVFDNKILASTWFGAYVSYNNGNSWSELNNEIIATNISSLACNSNHVIAGEFQTGIYRQTFGSDLWQRKNSGLTSVSVLDMTSMGDVFYAAVQNKRVFVSADNGNNWSWAGTGLNSDVSYLEADSIRALAITTGGTFNPGGLYQTSDTGNTWIPIPTGFGGKTCVQIDFNNIYVGCYQGKIFKTNNNGQSWLDISYNLPSEKINKILIKGSQIFVALDGLGLYKKHSSDTTWIYLNNGITNDTIKDLIYCNNVLYAATWGGGVFNSYDSGHTWATMNAGLTNLHLRKFTCSGNQLFAATDAGVFQYDFT
ncbi:MAG: WD40/YVTN/BNR-like repeat-containing protein, partial [Bacteroidota bacterium]